MRTTFALFRIMEQVSRGVMLTLTTSILRWADARASTFVMSSYFVTIGLRKEWLYSEREAMFWKCAQSR